MKFDSKKLIDTLMKNGFTDYKCPVCHGNSFGTQSDASMLFLTSKMDTIELKTYVPALLIYCSKCGHVDFFSVAKLYELMGEKNDDEWA